MSRAASRRTTSACDESRPTWMPARDAAGQGTHRNAGRACAVRPNKSANHDGPPTNACCNGLRIRTSRSVLPRPSSVPGQRLRSTGSTTKGDKGVLA